MTFLWPGQLWLLLLLPLLVFAYAALLRRRRPAALRYPNLQMVKAAMGGAVAWRRHVPPALLLAALTALVVAGARPSVVMTLATEQRTILLVMDVSGSMRAADVAPDRLTASQAAAKAFVSKLPRDVRIGVVAYGGTAHLVQAPTQSRADVLAAIDRFQLQPGTAIGSGIVVGLAALFPDAGIDLSRATGQRTLLLDDAEPPDPPALAPVPPGSYGPAAMVVLTDGQNTTGVDPMDAAQMAAHRGVRIFTVGFGTPDGEIVSFEGWSMRVRIDEHTMKQVAHLTLGEYFHAGSGTDLNKVYDTLHSRLVFETRETEVTALFGYLAGLLLLVAAGLSMRWFGRPL